MQKSLQQMVAEEEFSSSSESMLKTIRKSACSNPYVTNVFWQVCMYVYIYSTEVYIVRTVCVMLGYSAIQSNLGYPNSFVLRILYCVRISEFVQITAKINRKRLV